LPSLERLYRGFKEEPFVILGIDVQEDRDIVLKYVRDNSLSYPNLIDEDGMVSMQYKVSSTPTKWLVDTEGNLVGMALGYRRWDVEEMRSLIQALIDSRP
jgi:hypothetical protein